MLSAHSNPLGDEFRPLRGLQNLQNTTNHTLLFSRDTARKNVTQPTKTHPNFRNRPQILAGLIKQIIFKNPARYEQKSFADIHNFCVKELVMLRTIVDAKEKQCKITFSENDAHLQQLLSLFENREIGTFKNRTIPRMASKYIEFLSQLYEGLSLGHKHNSKTQESVKWLRSRTHSLFQRSYVEDVKLTIDQSRITSIQLGSPNGSTNSYWEIKLANRSIKGLLSEPQAGRDFSQDTFTLVTCSQEVHFLNNVFHHTKFNKCAFDGRYFIDNSFHYSKLENVLFKYAEFCNVSFKGSIITLANFDSATFDNMDFSSTTFNSTSFDKAIFKKASFCDSVLTDVSCKKTKFKDVDFRGATLSNVSLYKADFRGAIFDIKSRIKLKFSGLDDNELSGVRVAINSIDDVYFDLKCNLLKQCDDYGKQEQVSSEKQLMIQRSILYETAEDFYNEL